MAETGKLPWKLELSKHSIWTGNSDKLQIFLQLLQALPVFRPVFFFAGEAFFSFLLLPGNSLHFFQRAQVVSFYHLPLGTVIDYLPADIRLERAE